jgi:hypothetical protein
MVEHGVGTAVLHEVWLRSAYRIDRRKGRSFGYDTQFLYYRGELLGQTRDCIYGAARLLLEKGLADPNDTIQTIWEGSGRLSLRAIVGEAAKWTVVETDKRGPHLRRFRPRRGSTAREEPANCDAQQVRQVTGRADVTSRLHCGSPYPADEAPPLDLTHAPRVPSMPEAYKGEGDALDA